jgi:hypothetical protein
MIRFLLRFLGLMTLAGAFVFFVYDGTKSIAGNRLFMTSTRDAWSAVHPDSLQALQPAVEEHAAWLWDPVLLTILEQPAWLLLLILGALLILLGRRKKPLIGYAR